MSTVEHDSRQLRQALGLIGLVMMQILIAGSIMLAVACAPGCGSPPVARPQPAALAVADAGLLQGCYDCLLEARASYRRLAAGGDRPRVVARMFEADLLIALREKELALPPSDALADARRLAAELPRDVEPARYLALVDAIPSEAMGSSWRDLEAFRAARAARRARLDAERTWLSTGRLRAPVRDYLRLALDCAYPDPQAEPPRTAPSASAAPLPVASPLLAYRAQICGYGLMAALTAVRDREPRFVETSFFLASIEIVRAAQDGPGKAKAYLAEVGARFPTSPAVTFLTASYHQLVGDHASALRFFDRTLALLPAHIPALLGRTICLSNLDRAQEAIDAATRMIELHAGSLADAYYWRASNRRKLAQLALARADIDAAKELLTTGSVLSLAGIIEYDQRDLDPAEADLEAAIAAAGEDCTARWYLGLVHRQRKRWLVSGHAFEAAMGCYRERAEVTAERIRALEARAELDPDYREHQIASLEASVAADTRQLHTAALIAASDDAAGGDLAAARTLIEIAAQDPALAAGVAKLRDWLDKPRHSP
jgi:tetratricopeptide (TPR) repeat protein